MLRILLLDLKDDPGLIARYESFHAAGAVPKAIVRSIKAAGISQMEIFRTGNRLVMTMEVADDFDPAARAAADLDDPDVREWEALDGGVPATSSLGRAGREMGRCGAHLCTERAEGRMMAGWPPGRKGER